MGSEMCIRDSTGAGGLAGHGPVLSSMQLGRLGGGLPAVLGRVILCCRQPALKVSQLALEVLLLALKVLYERLKVFIYSSPKFVHSMHTASTTRPSWGMHTSRFATCATAATS